jgi:transmembrane sensor
MTLGDDACGIRPIKNEPLAAARFIAGAAANPFRSADRHMSTSSDSPEDALFEQAARWHLCLREAADEATWRAYRRWLAGDPRRAAAMGEAEQLLGMLRAPAADLARQGARTRRRRWIAAAAACLLLAGGGGLWLGGGGYARLRGDAVTAVGETRTLRLDDGSEITLNTDTVLQVAYAPRLRRVRLERGEAYFRVAHLPDRPFVVDTPSGQARVLGTVFDVRLDGDRTRVGVAEGHVAVRAQGGGNAVLGAGQSAWLDATGLAPGSERDADPDAAWRQGRLVFFRTPLPEVLASLERYRMGRLYLHGEALRRLTVSGAFDTTHPDAALDGLLATLHLRAVSLGWITIVYAA